MPKICSTVSILFFKPKAFLKIAAQMCKSNSSNRSATCIFFLYSFASVKEVLIVLSDVIAKLVWL